MACDRPRVDEIISSMKNKILCRPPKPKCRERRESETRSAGVDGVATAVAADDGPPSSGAVQDVTTLAPSVVVEKVQADAVSVVTAATEDNNVEEVTYIGLPKVVEELVMQPKLTFYINIHVLNKKKLIQSALTTKEETAGAAKESKGMAIPSFMGGFTAMLGAAVIPDATIIGEVTGELLKEFPKELERTGITAEFEQVFTKGTMAVLRCSIFDIDFETAIASEYKDEGMKHYQKLMAAMKFFDMSDAEIDSTLAELEHDILQDFPNEIANELRQEFENEGLEINVECKTEDDEGSYLFQYLQKHVQ